LKEKEEVEVKFYVSNFDDKLRKRVENIKPEMQHIGSKLEKNILFDDQEGSLKRKGKILRLRRWRGENTLTFKGPKMKSKFKRRPESEVKVDNFQETKRILNKLGFRKYMRYEKRREKFKFRLDENKLEVCFDKMPYGNFVEIEGNENDIPRVAGKLGFNWENRIVEDYIKIFENLRKERNLNFSDLTFKNFTKVNPKKLKFQEFIRGYSQSPKEF